MIEQMATVFASQAGVTTRVCLCGRVYLQVGYTCRILHHKDVLTLARAMKSIAQRLFVNHMTSPQERRHNRGGSI